MDKKIKKLLILLAVLAALCVSLAVISVINNLDKNDGTEQETTADKETIFFYVDSTTVSYFSYTYDNNNDGTAEEIEFNLLSDGSWQWEEDKNINIAKDYPTSFASSLNELTAKKVLTNVTSDELNAYGFDAPTKYITLRDNTNGKQTITFGTYNSYNSTYYVYINGKTDTVYLVDSAVFNTFEQNVGAFVEIDTITSIEEDCIVSLVYSDGTREVTCSFEPGDKILGTAGKWYRSVNGAEKTALPTEISTALTSLVTEMEYLACESVYESELADYGFTKDGDTIKGKATMTVNYKTMKRVVDDNGNVTKVYEDHSFTLSLGNTNSYNYFYVNPQGKYITYLLGGSAYYKVFCLSDAELAAATTQPAS